jgi:hypothetical protein
MGAKVEEPHALVQQDVMTQIYWGQLYNQYENIF